MQLNKYQIYYCLDSSTFSSVFSSLAGAAGAGAGYDVNRSLTSSFDIVTFAVSINLVCISKLACLIVCSSTDLILSFDIGTP